MDDISVIDDGGTRFGGMIAANFPPDAAAHDHHAKSQSLAGIGSFEVDLDTGIMVCTPAMRAILGWPDTAALTLDDLGNAAHPGDAKEFAAWRARSRVPADEPLDCHIRIIRGAADVRQLHLRSVTEPHGRGLRLTGTIQDVTDFVVGREALKQSLLLSQDAFENATWGMFQTTEDGQYLNANAALARIYGYDSAEAMRAALTDISAQLYVDPHRRDEFIQEMSEFGRVSGFESEIYRADGTVIWISESCREVCASDGKFLYYEGTVEEITARKQAEEALNAAKEHEREQSRRFEAALDNMSQGLCMVGSDGALIVSNHRFAEIYRLTPDDVTPGRPLRDVLERSPAFGVITDANQRGAFADHAGLVDVRSRAVLHQELPDGRTITITHEPMAEGGFVDTFTDVTEQRQAEAQIAHMAMHDPLTDLPNRALFRQRLEAALQRVPRGEPCAVFCLDLDQFKGVNDTLGHPVGDALLKAVTERLRRVVRSTDTIARLGGDEFAIVQSSVNQPEDATALAVRLLRDLNGTYEIGGHQVVSGTSIGIAIAPNDGTDPDQLLKSADMALYRAKSEGRSRYRYFEPEMDALMQARRALELDLRKAIAEKEFQLYFQPLVNVGKGSISGFEALLRWNSPERGMVSPADFIPLAEDIGLIVEIGEWVLHEACRQAATWPGNIKVAVNVSPVQFKSRRLVHVIADALEKSKLPARRLEIEITESVMLDDSTGAVAMLYQIKELGVGIAMDDFGTGYSSLSYLRQFPFDKIKIDQSFVRELGKKADCTAIIRAVTGLCDSLGVTATAEGVETSQQLDMLRDEHCTEIQGYLVSEPRPASEIAKFIAGFAETPLPNRADD